MADSTLSILIRDTQHPCAPYQSTSHTFAVQIFNCDGKPLFWKGIDYGTPQRLDVIGHAGGGIHAQIAVPSGCYLVRAIATCNNVITDWAWVEVCCAETVCVNLILPTVFHCIGRVVAGLQLGTVAAGGADRLIQHMPEEVRAAIRVLTQIADRLPAELNFPAPPDPGDIEKQEKERAA